MRDSKRTDCHVATLLAMTEKRRRCGGRAMLAPTGFIDGYIGAAIVRPVETDCHVAALLAMTVRRKTLRAICESPLLGMVILPFIAS